MTATMSRHRRHAVVIAFGLPVLVALTALFVTPPTFRAEAVVTLAPGPQPDESALPASTRAEIVAAEQRVATGPESAAMVDELVTFDHDYEVRADSARGTLRFVASAGSAVEAEAAANAASAGFVTRRSTLPDADRAPASTVSTPATLPSEPSSPDFVRLVVGAVIVGAALACATAIVTRRRSSEAAPEPRRAPLATAAGRRLVGVVGVATLTVTGLAGAHELWEVRTTTDAQVEAMIACIPAWLDEVPAGASIYPQPDPPEVRSQFWLVRLTELAFPRLRVAPDRTTADYTVKIVPAGPGGQGPCAGFEAIVRPT